MSLRLEPIVVKAHRIEDVVAVHAEKTGHEIRVAIGIDVAEVQMPRNGRRRRIYGIHRRVGVRVEVIDAVFLPERFPFGFGRLRVILFG